MLAIGSSLMMAILLEDGTHTLFESSTVPQFVEEEFPFAFETF